MYEFAQRSFIDGWERTKAVWTVPQGFGNDSYVPMFDQLPLLNVLAYRYWNREPTGKEFVVQSVWGINHGALGASTSFFCLIAFHLMH